MFLLLMIGICFCPGPHVYYTRNGAVFVLGNKYLVYQLTVGGIIQLMGFSHAAAACFAYCLAFAWGKGGVVYRFGTGGGKGSGLF